MQNSSKYKENVKHQSNQLDETNRRSSESKQSLNNDKQELISSENDHKDNEEHSQHDQPEEDEYDEDQFENMKSVRLEAKQNNDNLVDSPRVEDEPLQSNKFEKSPEVKEDNPYENNLQDEEYHEEITEKEELNMK